MHPNRRQELKLFDNITICHHCYSLLDEDLNLLQEEDTTCQKENNLLEAVA
jgi:hypothetical protein